MRAGEPAAETGPMSCAEFTPELPYPLDGRGLYSKGDGPTRRRSYRSLLLKTSLFLLFATPIVLPAFHLVQRHAGNHVEHAVRPATNGSPGGVITRPVACAPPEVASASCTLAGAAPIKG